MKNRLLRLGVVACILCTNANAGMANDSILEQRVLKIEKQLQTVKTEVNNNKTSIRRMEQYKTASSIKIDSISDNLKHTNQNVITTKDELQASVRDTDSKLQESISRTNDSLSSQATMLAMAIATSFLIVCLLIWFLRKYMVKKSDTIDSITKAQNALQQTQQELQDAQKKLAEESLSLDNKLLELMEKQLNLPQPKETSEVDHTLALKIADEITRMEVNLYRMDSSIRGHKQLTKAIERMRETYSSKGYEITKLIGEKYVRGMKAVAELIDDESLPTGSQIITAVKKPQVMFNKELLQSAEITVSQNI